MVTDARRKEVYWAAYDGAGARTGGPGAADCAGWPRFAAPLFAATAAPRPR